MRINYVLSISLLSANFTFHLLPSTIVWYFPVVPYLRDVIAIAKLLLLASLAHSSWKDDLLMIVDRPRVQSQSLTVLSAQSIAEESSENCLKRR